MRYCHLSSIVFTVVSTTQFQTNKNTARVKTKAITTMRKLCPELVTGRLILPEKFLDYIKTRSACSLIWILLIKSKEDLILNSPKLHAYQTGA